MLSRRRFLTLAGVAVSGLMADGLVLEPNFIVSKSRVSINAKLWKNLDGFRIAHISDTHFGFAGLLNPETVYSKVLSMVREIRPDAIAYTGDLISREESAEEALKFVEKLSRTSPVFIVWGNWDHLKLKRKLNAFKDELESAGEVAVLNNESLELENRVYLAGVDDPFTGRDRLDSALPAGYGFKILLAHSPQIIGSAAGRVEVILSGHTHGGQVVLPFVGPAYVPLPERYRKYASGLYEIRETLLYVNRGIGMSFLPVRFMCPPEVAEIEFRS